MQNIVRLPDFDGSIKTFYRLKGERLKQYPLYVVVPMQGPLEMLERLRDNEDYPTIDVDALLQTAVDGMFHRTKNMERARAMREIIREVLMDSISVFHDGFVVRGELEHALMLVFQACYDTFIQYGLYELDGVLPYDYLHRRGNNAIVLQRRDLIPLD